MSNYQPTEKQQKAIESRGHVLVSAAAGSGKTRVLTERIVGLIASGADIMDMMIATFTNAAATEMKSRISKVLNKHSDNEWMRKQAELVSCAQIGTYHNFCTNILRENYLLAELPYNFKVLDGEYTKTIKADICTDMLSELIEKDDSSVIHIIDKYSKRFRKKEIAKIIIEIYNSTAKMKDADSWLEWASSMTLEEYTELSENSVSVERDYDKTMPDVRIFVRLVKEFRARYSREKANIASLDFDDLLQKTYALLKVKEIKYKYVLVDEYQDTNPIQDAIISGIAGDELFFVGDKKQGIYGFNYADPHIFMNKEEQYSENCIFMNENFRSSAAVADAVNFVMEKCMASGIGGMKYDEREKLIARSNISGEVKIYLDEEPVKAAERGRLAAEMLALKIKNIIGSEIDDNGCRRPAEPGDIAVLYRSQNETVAQLPAVLTRYGIPYSAGSDKTKTESKCAEVFMDILKAVASPDRDLPVTALLLYPKWNINENDLAEIRLATKDISGNISFVKACRLYIKNHTNHLSGRLSAFFDVLSELRLYFDSYSIEDFLYYSADKFGLFDYAVLRSESEYRALFSLMNTIAGCGEKSLPMIIKYMEDYKSEYDCYAGLDSGVSSSAVNIMTVHKSKGLEFPVVFLVNMDKTINENSINKKNKVLVDNSYGILPLVPDEDYIPQIREIAAKKKKEELVAEELRLLYVAMTRAKNSLYICAFVDNVETYRKKLQGVAEDPKKFCDAKCMLDFILGACLCDPKVLTVEKGLEEDQEAITDIDEKQSEKTRGENSDWIIFDGPNLTRAKVTVSEVKKGESRIRFNPVSFDSEDGTSGTEFGTLVHSVMEKAVVNGNPEETLDDMEARQLITNSERKELEDFSEHIFRFFDSSIYKRVRNSETVLVEQPFIVKKDAAEIRQGTGEIMMQGVIDLAFIEDGGFVILDYKTDHINESNREKLIEAYSMQLELYAEALETVIGKKVREKILYFLRTDEEVRV